MFPPFGGIGPYGTYGNLGLYGGFEPERGDRRRRFQRGPKIVMIFLGELGGLCQ